MLGEAAAAAAAAKTNTFLGERYRRIVKRRDKLKALVAVDRSILVVVWHLLIDGNARFRAPGADYHTRHIDTDASFAATSPSAPTLGYRVIVTPARTSPNIHLHILIQLRNLRWMLSPATHLQHSPVSDTSARSGGAPQGRRRSVVATTWRVGISIAVSLNLN